MKSYYLTSFLYICFMVFVLTLQGFAQTKIPLEAIQNNSVEEVRLAIVKGADVNSKENDGWTALIDAKNRGFDEMVSLPKKHGAK